MNEKCVGERKMSENVCNWKCHHETFSILEEEIMPKAAKKKNKNKNAQ